MTLSTGIGNKIRIKTSRGKFAPEVIIITVGSEI
jgi:hypothetical protein